MRRTAASATLRDLDALPQPHRRALLRRRPGFLLATAIALGWVVIALGWRGLGLEPFADTGHTLAPPSVTHWLGTDRIGRDVLARVLAGSESAVAIGVIASMIATVVGAVLGLIAGFRRGWVDAVLMRTFDIALAVPAVLLLLVVVAAFGSGMLVLASAIGLLFAPTTARIVRARVLGEMSREYITAARLQGESEWRILFVELLPNIWPHALVQATLTLGSVVFVAASLSFLGLFAAPPSPDWGLAISENRAYLRGAWWTVVFPALAIASLVVSVHVVGDNLKEVLHR